MFAPGELDKRFKHHPPTEGQPTKYALIRSHCRELAQLIDETAPDSREKSLAVTSLEETMMWTNAAIARNT